MSDLVPRFVAGSNHVDIDWHTPGTTHHAFFIGMPSDTKKIARIGEKMLARQHEISLELTTGHRENLAALNEINHQLGFLRGEISNGFTDLSDAISILERSMGLHLSEIKVVLGQIDSRLAELVKLVKFPRETEAKELIEDGLKALKSGNAEDARLCLSEAVEKKRVSFPAHLNLAYAYLNEGNADSAIVHFRKAVDYSDSDQLRSFALIVLARVLFAARSFSDAVAAIEQATQLSPEGLKPEEEYARAVYHTTAGDAPKAVEILRDLGRKHPKYFAVADVDRDLAPIRESLLDSLNELTARTVAQAEQEYSEVSEALAESLHSLGSEEFVAEEVVALRDALQLARSRIDQQKYTSALAAREILKPMRAATMLLSELRDARRTASSAEARLNDASEAEAKYKDKKKAFQEGIDAKIAPAKRLEKKVQGVTFTVVASAWVILMIMLIVDVFSGGFWSIMKGLFILIPFGAVLLLIAGAVVYFVPVIIAGIIAHLREVSAKSVWFSDEHALADATATASDRKREYDEATERLNRVDKQIREQIADANRTIHYNDRSLPID